MEISEYLIALIGFILVIHIFVLGVLDFYKAGEAVRSVSLAVVKTETFFHVKGTLKIIASLIMFGLLVSLMFGIRATRSRWFKCWPHLEHDEEYKRALIDTILARKELLQTQEGYTNMLQQMERVNMLYQQNAIPATQEELDELDERMRALKKTLGIDSSEMDSPEMDFSEMDSSKIDLPDLSNQTTAKKQLEKKLEKLLANPTEQSAQDKQEKKSLKRILQQSIFDEWRKRHNLGESPATTVQLYELDVLSKKFEEKKLTQGEKDLFKDLIRELKPLIQDRISRYRDPSIAPEEKDRLRRIIYLPGVIFLNKVRKRK